MSGEIVQSKLIPNFLSERPIIPPKINENT